MSRFRKGALVQRYMSGTWVNLGRYVGLDKPNDFSRAYGPQCFVYDGPGPVPTVTECQGLDLHNTTRGGSVQEVGVGDLRLAPPAPFLIDEHGCIDGKPYVVPHKPGQPALGLHPGWYVWDPEIGPTFNCRGLHGPFNARHEVDNAL